jgi:hypothetical protein
MSTRDVAALAFEAAKVLQREASAPSFRNHPGTIALS